jgi:hypothetical protein
MCATPWLIDRRPQGAVSVSTGLNNFNVGKRPDIDEDQTGLVMIFG